MSTQGVLFAVVCGIATLNSLLLAGYLLRPGRGDRRLNVWLAALILCVSARVGKTVALLFLAHLHPIFELLWLVALAVTGIPVLLYAHRLTAATAGVARSLLVASAIGAVPGGLAMGFLPLGMGWRLMGASLALYAAMAGGGACFVARWWRDPAADRLRRRWVAWLLSFVGAVWLLNAALLAFRLAGSAGEEESYFYCEAVLFSLAVYAVVYLELRYGLIARIHPAGTRDRVDPGDPMLKRLRHAVEDDRLFLDPSLSLPSLARSLKLAPQHVSRLINAGIGSSFNDYLNRLRVEEACRILAGPDGASRKIGALAYDCGFGSASVFYAAFRKFTGQTPSDFQKNAARPSGAA